MPATTRAKRVGGTVTSYRASGAIRREVALDQDTRPPKPPRAKKGTKAFGLGLGFRNPTGVLLYSRRTELFWKWYETEKARATARVAYAKDKFWLVKEEKVR